MASKKADTAAPPFATRSGSPIKPTPFAGSTRPPMQPSADTGGSQWDVDKDQSPTNAPAGTSTSPDIDNSSPMKNLK